MFGKSVCLLVISTVSLSPLLLPVALLGQKMFGQTPAEQTKIAQTKIDQREVVQTAIGQTVQDNSRLPLLTAPLSNRIPWLPEPAPTVPEPVLPPRLPVTLPGGFGFPQFARAAGIIFSGTVTKVEPRPATAASGHAVTTIAITFHIENAIRGATSGQDLTISQWIGAWSSGQRYRVGERVFLFLYPRSKLGLTSCVGGAMGRLAIDPLGRVLLTAQHLAAFRNDPILGGKSRVDFNDFALAVRRLGEEE
jgi:hypothetical protein